MLILQTTGRATCTDGEGGVGRGNVSIEIREVVSGMNTADGQVTENKLFDVHFVQKNEWKCEKCREWLRNCQLLEKDW